jgi:hypothetical protein
MKAFRLIIEGSLPASALALACRWRANVDSNWPILVSRVLFMDGMRHLDERLHECLLLVALRDVFN